MKRMMLTALMALCTPLPVLAGGCMDAALTQGQANGCAQKTAAEADKQLNAVYRDAMARVGSDSALRKKLTAAQKAWIGFRDAECALVATGAGGGSAAPMVEQGCIEDLTRKRIDVLQGYLHCPEGDLSCPLPRAD